MKRHIIISLAAAALLSACTKDETAPDTPAGEGYGVQVTALSPQTRTVLEHNDNGISVKWSDTDEIGIWSSVGGSVKDANIRYLAIQSGKSSAFRPENKNNVAKWQDETSSHDFYAIYPYNADAGADLGAIPVSVPAVQTQRTSGSTAHLGKLDFLYAATKGVTMPEDKSVNFAFRHPLSIMALSLDVDKGRLVTDQVIVRFKDTDEIFSAEGASIDITADSPAIDCSKAVTSNEIRVKLSQKIKLTPDAVCKIYMLITPGHGGKRFEVALVVDGNEQVIAERGIPAEGIPAGVTASIDLTAAGEEHTETVIDLSELGTANCYVVSDAETTYKFRADIAGNGTLPDGFEQMGLSAKLAPAKARLLKSMVASGSYKNGTLDGTDPTMSKMIDVSSVALRNENGIPYIYFTTADILDFAAGNAVICATDEQDAIIWSWHIWVTPDWKIGRGDIRLSANDGCANAVIMDRNLGALSNGQDEGYSVLENAQAACGLMYQWGRKDPFQYINVGVNEQAQGNYQMADGTIVRTKKACEIETAAGSGSYTKKLDFLTDQTAPDMATAVKYVTANPETFFTRFNGATEYTASLFEPDSRSDRFGMWGNPSKYTYTKFSGHKTAYDPCPVGYRVPDPHVLSFIVRSQNSMNTAKSVLEGGDLNAFNIDYSKSQWIESSKSVDFTQSYGIYAYTGSSLEKDQDASERANTQTTFIPIFNTLWYSSAEGNGKSESTSLMTTMFQGNRPGYNIQNSGFIACFGFYDYHTAACPVRCMAEKAKIGDIDQIDGSSSSINGLDKVNPWE